MSKLMPPNATQLETLAAEAGANATQLPVILRALWKPEDCPESLLPWLAWSWSVDSWENSWSTRQKRDTIAAALDVHKIKGTIGAVSDALGALGFVTRVQEWHRKTPAGEPYTFRVQLDVNQEPMSQSDIQRALTLIQQNKSLRSHLETVVQQIRTTSSVFVAAASGAGHNLGAGYDGLSYSDWPATDLMTDAAYHGTASTTAAVDRLHLLLHNATYRDLLVDADRATEARTVAALDRLHTTIQTLHEGVDA